MNWRQSITAFLVVAALCSVSNRALSQSSASAAFIREHRQTLPKEHLNRFMYLELEPSTGLARKQLEAVARFAVCSTSLAPVMERIRPELLPGSSLLVIDLHELGWSLDDWITIVKRYPYWDFESERVLPSAIRADWFVRQVADQSTSDTYLRLLFGGKTQPKNRDEFLQKLGVVSDRPDLQFGMIEGQSGVAKHGTRWLENRPILRGHIWGTRDTDNLVSANDPLEHADGSHAHQAEEWIALTPLTSESGVRGLRFISILANGEGALQTKAPVNIVEDFTKFLGNSEIINPGSCWQCHTIGYNLPTLNEVSDLIEEGINLAPIGNEKLARNLAAFHLGDIRKELYRANEDYQLMTTLITGLESKEVSAALKSVIDRYVARLDMEAAAEEFVSAGYEVGDFVNAMSYGANGGYIGARLTGLTKNRPMPREAWEEQYVTAKRVLNKWKNDAKKPRGGFMYRHRWQKQSRIYAIAA